MHTMYAQCTCRTVRVNNHLIVCVRLWVVVVFVVVVLSLIPSAEYNVAPTILCRFVAAVFRTSKPGHFFDGLSTSKSHNFTTA